MGRRKKTIEEEVREGFRRLAFGDIKDAVTLLYADEAEVMGLLPSLDLFHVSEIKRPRGGGMEIKFFDRIKALEKLAEFSGHQGEEPVNFYRALEESAKHAKNLFGDDSNER